MKRLLIFAALYIVPMTGFAQNAKPDVVLIPRDVATTARNWLAEPNAGIAVKLYAALSACIQDNPNKGVVKRSGADQCPTVTEAVTAHEKELADLHKEIADLKTAAAQKAK